ncbi:MAG: 2'-5' RNA ligase family protein [Proteobacteria bacterium]|nr:2'-5' RNA ligase family protein [Pseudomonadota bacterium]
MRASLPTAERLFFAVRPDAANAQRIEALAQAVRRRHGLRGKSLGPERFHVTLHLIGDFARGIPAQVLASALDAARPVAAQASPFLIGLDTLASFTRKRRNIPLVLLGEDGVQDVARLQQALLAALTATNVAGRVEPGFTPHLTLLYDDQPLAPQAIEPVSWRVEELLLMRSLLGRSRHEVLARLPLGA